MTCLKLQLKENFWKFLDELVSGKCQYTKENLCNEEISPVTLLISDSTTDTLLMISKIPGTMKNKFLRWN